MNHFSRLSLWRFVLLIAFIVFLGIPSMLISSVAQAANHAISEVRGLALHPDGQILAIGARYNDQPGIWFYDLVHDTITGIPTSGNVSSLSWRPDGNVIAAGVAVGEGQTIQVYDTAGVLLFEFDAESTRRQVIWSRDGTRFMTPAGNRAVLRDGNMGEILEAFAYPESNRRLLDGIAWSETHNRLYGTFDIDPEVLVWDTSTGEVLTSYALPFTSWGPELNHAETLLAVGSKEGDGRVLILDALTGSIVHDITRSGGGFLIVVPVWSPDDSKIAISTGSHLEIWEVASAELLHSFTVQEFTNSDVMVWTDDSASLIFSDGETFPVRITLPYANPGLNLTTIPTPTATSTASG